jgi:hypothetical protein
VTEQGFEPLKTRQQKLTTADEFLVEELEPQRKC